MVLRPAATAIGQRMGMREAHATWRAGTARNRRASPLPAKHPTDLRDRNRARGAAARREQPDNRQPSPSTACVVHVRVAVGSRWPGRSSTETTSLVASVWSGPYAAIVAKGYRPGGPEPDRGNLIMRSAWERSRYIDIISIKTIDGQAASQRRTLAWRTAAGRYELEMGLLSSPDCRQNRCEQSVNNSFPNTPYWQVRARATGTKNLRVQTPASIC